tara:strand:- start:758 stop:904 length:147 start_codon:yes stop_codon:yes gene_type:complete
MKKVNKKIISEIWNMVKNTHNEQDRKDLESMSTKQLVKIWIDLVEDNK